jgi:hypothetical protein
LCFAAIISLRFHRNDYSPDTYDDHQSKFCLYSSDLT